MNTVCASIALNKWYTLLRSFCIITRVQHLNPPQPHLAPDTPPHYTLTRTTIPGMNTEPTSALPRIQTHPYVIIPRKARNLKEKQLDSGIAKDHYKQHLKFVGPDKR